MLEPAYTFTLPSLADDTVLDCRLYHPKRPGTTSASDSLGLAGRKGAVLAHPYAPLGGSFDDPVVLSVAQTLLDQGYVTATFNFRGAGDSAGRTSWSGRAEQEDYISVIGFVIYYLHYLDAVRADGGSSPLGPTPCTSRASDSNTNDNDTPPQGRDCIHLLLGGYSYGSLVLARLAPLPAIIQRFHEAVLGSAAVEVVLRARTLAKKTQQTLFEVPNSASPRGRPRRPEAPRQAGQPRVGASTVTVGGEETHLSERRASRDSKRSADFVRKSVEIPHRIKSHIRRMSGDMKPVVSKKPPQPASGSAGNAAPVVVVRYLIISPVLLPFTSILCPPGPALSVTEHSPQAADDQVGTQVSRSATLAVFGSSDMFTSSRRLRAWATKQSKVSPSASFAWRQIEGAGHFWREGNVMQVLQQTVAAWVEDGSTQLNSV